MLLKPLTVAVAGLAAATAFLLPPEITESDVGNVPALPFEVPQFAETKLVKVTCPGCPLQFRNHRGKVRVKQGIDNYLELAFKVDHQPDNDRLLLNGFELYPNSHPLDDVLTAPQVPDCKKAKNRGQNAPKPHKPHRKFEPASPRLGFSLQWQPVTKEKVTELELITLDFQIIEVGNNFVDGIPSVHIKLIKTVNGGLMIGDIEVTASQTVSNPMDKQEECTTIICKWKAIISDNINRIKAHKCGKMGKAGKMDKAGHHQNKGQHHVHHNHGSGRPLREHSWSQLFKKFASHILFPVLVGIVAGVSVSIIGMMVGTLIVGLWRVFVRGQPFFHQRRRHHHHHHKAAQKEAVAEEEKSGLMDHQDPPPSYKEDGNNVVA